MRFSQASERSVALAAGEPGVWASVGLHPHEVAKAQDGAFERLRALARQPRVVAIGECGLDFYRDLSPRDLQREWFERQLGLAHELALPLVIHVRDAMDETLDRLEKAQPPRAGVMHCWSGDAAQANRAVALGFKLGFGGTLTYGVAAYEDSARTVPDRSRTAPATRSFAASNPASATRVRSGR